MKPLILLTPTDTTEGQRQSLLLKQGGISPDTTQAKVHSVAQLQLPHPLHLDEDSTFLVAMISLVLFKLYIDQ